MRALVIGGAACGKSEYAEALASACPEPRFYIATMMPFDAEDALRIERHRAMREKKGFFTVERYFGLDGLVLPGRGTVLLECLGNLAANELFADGGAGAGALSAVISGVMALERQSNDLVVVTNDVFSGGDDYSGDTLRYMEVLAAANRELAGRFDKVIEVVCGIPVALKGALA